jgi:hypothetical protein
MNDDCARPRFDGRAFVFERIRRRVCNPFTVEKRLQ